MRLFFIFIKSLLLSIMCFSVAYGQGSGLNIIYTGGLAGQLEPCGCSPKSDFGGVARIAGYLREHRGELSPYIVVDAGNFTAEDSPQGRLKTEAMVRAFGAIKYDVVAVSGDEEELYGDFLRSLLIQQELHAVSDIAGYKGMVHLEKGEFSINISADPDAVEKNKLNLLLTALSVKDAKSIKGWDVIISSAGEKIDEPAKDGETIIVSGYPKGEKLGILTLQKSREGIFTSKHTWQPVGNDLDEDSGVRSILNDYDKKVAMLLKDAEASAVGTTYAGAKKCAECHQPFYEQWQTTRHANAFESLVAAGKSADPECIVCHVVGFGEEGGFFSFKGTPELADVQCEACHGIGREHSTDYTKPMLAVTETVCLECHTKENSPDFDYNVYLGKINH